MKKFLCILMLVVAILAFSACKDIETPNYGTLIARNPAAAQTIEYKDYSAVRETTNEVMIPYSAEFISAFLQTEGGNTICSPLTAYFGLSLAAESTKGRSQQEILSALKLNSVEQLRECADLFYNASTKDNAPVSKEIVTNSLWLDPEIAYNQTTLDNLAQFHHAFVVPASFRNNNAKSNKALNDFVYKQSNKLLKTNFQLDSNTLFVLVSTLYVSDLWNAYDDLTFTKDTYAFTNDNGTQTNTKLIDAYFHGGKLLETETYSAFPVKSSCNYKLYFIVPNGGHNIADVMNTANITNVLTYNYPMHNDEFTLAYETRVLFPQFSVEATLSLTNTLNKMGISTAFGDNADLSGLLVNSKNAYFAGAIQANKLRVDNKGFEGASVFMIPGAGAAAPMETIYYTLTVDRSFGFILTDTFNIPLFGGIVQNLD